MGGNERRVCEKYEEMTEKRGRNGRVGKGEKREKWSTLVKNDELTPGLLYSATAAGENIPPMGAGWGCMGWTRGAMNHGFWG